VKNFADLAKPLHNLTKKNSKFVWTDACQNSFDKHKEKLTSSPILLHPNTQRQFILSNKYLRVKSFKNLIFNN